MLLAGTDMLGHDAGSGGMLEGCTREWYTPACHTSVLRTSVCHVVDMTHVRPSASLVSYLLITY